MIFSLQDYLIFPGRSSQGTARAIIGESTWYEKVPLTTRDHETTVAIFGAALNANGTPRADAARQPTVLFFYGNAMCLADCFSQYKQFRLLGCNVMIPEYVGYGLASGKASETSLYETADAAYDALLKRSDIDPHKVIAAGWSLGAAVAIDLAHRRDVAGLATFSAFTSLPEMAHNLIPWAPTSLLLRHRFDSIAKMPDIKTPIFLAHGRRDSIIQFSMQKRLLEAAIRTSHVTNVEVDTDHNDIFEAGDELWVPFAKLIDEMQVARSVERTQG